MKVKKIKIVIAFALILIVSTLKAQVNQPNDVKEFGIGLSSLNSFSLQYRWGNENRLFRITGTIGGTTSNGNSSNNTSDVLDTTYNNSSSTSTSNKSPINLNCGLGFSILKLKSISQKFEFMYGGICSISYIYSNTQSTQTGSSINNGITYPDDMTSKRTSQTLQPSIGIVIGAVYKISSSFLLYAEIAPNIYYAYNKTTTNSTYSSQQNEISTSNTSSSNNTFGVSGLSNSGASLTIVYRIPK